MQHLSNHTLGSRSCCITKAWRHCWRASHLAWASSCQEWEMKASHWNKLSGAALDASAGLSLLSAMSSKHRSASSTLRKRSEAWAITSLTGHAPTKPATPAAARFSLSRSKAAVSNMCPRCRRRGREMKIASASCAGRHQKICETARHRVDMTIAMQVSSNMFINNQTCNESHMRRIINDALSESIARMKPAKRTRFRATSAMS
mmetsp:Transcript_137290/g.342291  ORF Transcript_137290/g.342291 Transcript_137290/m.342291 type:complete len:204 (+) Transcript_137290:700-1311(+)